MSGSFNGFSPSLIGFLSELAENNNREWFLANKPLYESEVLGPALDFIAAMEQPLAKLAPRFLALPKRMGGSLMRVYRDTRFSRNKLPYKTNVGIQFRHELGKDAHAPGFYFHIAPDSVFVGAGSWRPASDALFGIRTRIAERPGEWLKSVNASDFQTNFRLGGESLKRPPRGFDGEHPQIEDIKRKDFIAIKDLDQSFVVSNDIVDQVASYFESAKPYMRFLCKAIGVPY
ncbi:MAG: DUF2461 domain-containing protein [Gammaproteobacteria bacterium]